jgi:hypothetical protein
LELVVYTDAD